MVLGCVYSTDEGDAGDLAEPGEARLIIPPIEPSSTGYVTYREKSVICQLSCIEESFIVSKRPRMKSHGQGGRIGAIVVFVEGASRGVVRM
jgi:hypothetical protein